MRRSLHHYKSLDHGEITRLTRGSLYSLSKVYIIARANTVAADKVGPLFLNYRMVQTEANL